MDHPANRFSLLTGLIGNATALCLLGFGTHVLAVTPVGLVPTTLAHKVAVGGHSLYISCIGEGSPTVVMEAGYGDASEVWAKVQAQIATLTRVCVYDRAGLGRSDVVGQRSVQDVVADLVALIENGPVGGPVVLVGHSIGGLIATMLAHDRPEMVAGLVLVDSSHPDQLPRLHRRLPRAWLEALNTFFADTPAFETWDSDLATAQGQTPYLRSGSLQDLPLVVLTRDVERIDPDGIAWIKENIWPDYSTEIDRRYGAAWLELQKDYLTLSTDNTHVVVKGSTHYIHKDRPEVVVEAVRRVVTQTRTRSQGLLVQEAR